MSLFDRIWGGKRVEPASPEDTADYWLNQGFIRGKAGQHEEATKCFEKAKALKLDKNPIKFTIPINDYALYYPIISDLLGTMDVKLIGDMHSAYCTKCGVRFRKETLEMLCMAQAFKKHGSETIIRGASTQGNDFRAGRCPNCGHSEIAITVEVQGIVPPRQDDIAEDPVKIGTSSVSLYGLEEFYIFDPGVDAEEAVKVIKKTGIIPVSEKIDQLFVTAVRVKSIIKASVHCNETLLKAAVLVTKGKREGLVAAIRKNDDQFNETVLNIIADLVIEAQKAGGVLIFASSKKDERLMVSVTAAALREDMTLRDDEVCPDSYMAAILRCSLEKDSAEAWFNRGNAFYKMCKYDEAIRAFDKAIELKPDPINAAYSHANKGLALGDLEKYDDAIRMFDKAIEIKPDYAAAWYNKGIALKALGRDTEADAAIAKAKVLGYTG